MVAPKAPPHLQSRRRRNNTIRGQNDAMCKWCLAIAAVLSLAALLLIQSPGGGEDASMIRSKFHSMVKRYEVAGYGATHPRAAFILVATPDLSDPVESMTKSISSILEHTDRNRILVICAVFQEGVLSSSQQSGIQSHLDELDAGTSVHWHGLTKHTHGSSPTDHEHGHKIRALFSEHKSVSASRIDATTFVEYLVKEHEEADLKSPEEHILAVFVRPDSELDTDHWMDTVTHSVMSSDSAMGDVHTPMRNAVSFAASTTSTYVEGETKSINLALKPAKSHASSRDRYSTHDKAYPTPIVEGSVTAMALQTFLELPVADEMLDSHFAADVELSWNLWMCADGIDIVSFLHAKTTLGTLQHKDKAGMSVNSMARLAHTWMEGEEENVGRQVLQLAEKAGYNPDDEKVLDYLPVKASKCRSFEWYIQEVNTVMKKELDELPIIPRKEDDEYYKEGEEPEEMHHQHGRMNLYRRRIPRRKEEKVLVKPEGKKEDKQDNTVEDKQSDKENADDKAKTNKQDDTENADDEAKTEIKEKKIPMKPLSSINKKIISTAQMVDLAYVDVTDGFVSDPHRGALDENGQFGYVHDEKALRNNPPKFEVTKEQAKCGQKDGTVRMLTKKVFVDHVAHEAAERLAENAVKPRAKIFCLVYTISTNHHRIPNIRETWAQKCDGFMVGSDKTDRELGTVNIPHEGPEEYNNIWQKVRSMWSYIYDNYYEEYDWFHIGGDDLYVLVENLRLYVESEEIQLAANGGEFLPADGEVITKQLPLFLGRRFKEQGNEERIFNSGGSGYTMNKAALKALVVEAFPKCMSHLKTFAEDVMVAQCFRNRLKVFPFDTKDEAGGERYMPFQPQHHLNYRMPENKAKDWYATYSIDIKFGLDHCAARSVAFHYIKDDLMKRMHAILYGHCD